MTVQKSVTIVCDDCRDARVTVEGSSQGKAWLLAKLLGWRAVAARAEETWRGRVHVCVRCIEYGRPYKDSGVPTWRGLGVSA